MGGSFCEPVLKAAAEPSRDATRCHVFRLLSHASRRPAPRSGRGRGRRSIRSQRSGSRRRSREATGMGSCNSASPRREPCCRRISRSGAPLRCDLSLRSAPSGKPPTGDSRRRRAGALAASPTRRRRCAAANISTPSARRRCGARSRGLRRRTRRERPGVRRVSRRARQPLAARRPGAFQSRRKPQGRRAPFRLPRHLRRLARRAWRAPPCAARGGPARIRRRGGEERPFETPGAGQPGERKLRLAEGHRRQRRDLPSAALDAAGSDAAPHRRRGAGAGGPRRPDAGGVARRPAEPPGGRSDGRLEGAFAGRRGAIARLSGRREPRRRAAHSARRSRGCSPRPTASRCCAANGSKSTPRAEGDPRPLRRDRAARERGACRSARRCGCSPAPTSAQPRRAGGGRVLGARDGRRWLAETLAACREPETLAAAASGRRAEGDLRPYQDVGAALARLSHAPRPRRLPRRRHGARQDRAGAGAAVDARGARRTPAQPHRCAGFAAGQLGGGSRALRTVAERLRRASRLHAGGAAEVASAEALAGPTSS